MIPKRENSLTTPPCAVCSVIVESKDERMDGHQLLVGPPQMKPGCLD
jgi:hypothetical protein